MSLEFLWRRKRRLPSLYWCSSHSLRKSWRMSSMAKPLAAEQPSRGWSRAACTVTKLTAGMAAAIQSRLTVAPRSQRGNGSTRASHCERDTWAAALVGWLRTALRLMVLEWGEIPLLCRGEETCYLYKPEPGTVHGKEFQMWKPLVLNLNGTGEVARRRFVCPWVCRQRSAPIVFFMCKLYVLKNSIMCNIHCLYFMLKFILDHSKTRANKVIFTEG